MYLLKYYRCVTGSFCPAGIICRPGHKSPRPSFWTTGASPGGENLLGVSCSRLAAAGRAAAAVAFQAGTVAHQGKVAAFGAGVAFVALPAGFGVAPHGAPAEVGRALVGERG